ncbi:hypothetical protein K402DRAFT_109520 [Aulographum hederae CBS 113979]|uniref:Uncharacterized protein n=1 Tax=Aulographum hederae CBS 113979 TaxID=1176131 RepID=A0A6G1GWZ5_9PEZI|nr:hypothetical protein K402DRAFT_109520 [Aulographum hederae CBS 113979]
MALPDILSPLPARTKTHLMQHSSTQQRIQHSIPQTQHPKVPILPHILQRQQPSPRKLPPNRHSRAISILRRATCEIRPDLYVRLPDPRRVAAGLAEHGRPAVVHVVGRVEPPLVLRAAERVGRGVVGAVGDEGPALVLVAVDAHVGGSATGFAAEDAAVGGDASHYVWRWGND